MKRALRRMRAACRTNDVQWRTVVLFSLFNVMAVLSRPGAPVWFIAACGLFWPACAYVFNLIHPLPPDS